MNHHGEVYYWHYEANICTYDKPPEFPAHDPKNKWVRLLYQDPDHDATYYDYSNPVASVFFSNALRDKRAQEGVDTCWAEDWTPSLGFNRTHHRWEEHYDARFEKVFYVHAATRRVSWHPPPDADDDFFFLHHLLEKKHRAKWR